MLLTAENLDSLAFAKTTDGLLPAIIQHATDGRVLMVGYVSAESLRETFASGRVTFFSRSKGRLWTKGEASGHVLDLVLAKADCDRDAVLLLVRPQGPTCHTGAETCFDDAQHQSAGYGSSPAASDLGQANLTPAQELTFLTELEDLLHARVADADSDSYTSRLLAKGIMKVAQKVGEEGVEMALEAVGGTDQHFTEEAADLMYHYLLLLRAKGQRLADVAQVLKGRMRAGE